MHPKRTQEEFFLHPRPVRRSSIRARPLPGIFDLVSNTNTTTSTVPVWQQRGGTATKQNLVTVPPPPQDADEADF
jgi:hypothetical protein